MGRVIPRLTGAPVVLLLMLGLAAPASAAVRCVGSSGGDCASTHSTINGAVAAAGGGDTVRIAAGTYAEAVDTSKVLTFQGAGRGTPDDTSGATVVEPPPAAEPGPAFRLSNGGTLRDLQAHGANWLPDGSGIPGPGGGTGLDFRPQSSGTFALQLDRVVVMGGDGAESGGPGLLAFGSSGRRIELSADQSIFEATVSGAAAAVPGFAVGGEGTSTVTRSKITNGGGSFSGALGVGGGHTLTLDASEVKAGSGSGRAADVGDGTLIAKRSRIEGPRFGLTAGSGASVLLTDSLVRSYRQADDYASQSALQVEGQDGARAGVIARGTTFAQNGGPYGSAVSVGSGGTVTLRNSIARIDPAMGGADLVADSGTIDADYTSFSTRRLANGGTAPWPGTAHNVFGDPLFTDPDGGDFTVQHCSPVIDRGNTALVGSGDLDLAGNPRSLDGNGDGSARPDLGAFERTDVSTGCPPPPTAPAEPSEPSGPNPPAPKPAIPLAKNLAPTLSHLSLSPRAFAVAPRRGPWRGRGTRFRVHLSERSTVKLTFERVVKRCTRFRSGRKRGRRCRTSRRSGWLKSLQEAGAQSIRFSGRLKGRALAPGVWRVTARAYDGQGARSATKRLRLRVVAR